VNAQASEKTKYEEQQYVVFTLGEESFGADINKVREIIVYRETTNIPGTTDLIEGIINLRGKVIPIYSLRKKFGFSGPEEAGNTRIVVIEVRESTGGIIVDGVSEVLMISGDVVEKPSSMICQGVEEDYIEGIAKIDDRLIIILDLEEVISSNMVQAV
jgi:purine-binding chemotaxis protein CheW